MPDNAPIRVINVICTSYSGNTWLNLMLGAHSEAFCVGELKSIYKSGEVVCIMHGQECPVWSRFDPDADMHPYVQIAQLTGKNNLIVSNSLKYLPVDGDPALEHRFIHLIRDGRAVAASFMRKHENMKMWHAARRWMHDYKKNIQRLKDQPASAVLTVYYEKLKNTPDEEIRRICEFMGLSYEPSMLEYWGQDQHYLGGNRGTLFALARKQGEALPEDKREDQQNESRDWKLDFYEKGDPEKFVDERWKTDLSSLQLRIFGFVAGALNRKLGY